MHIVWLVVSLGRLQAALGYFLAISWDLFTVVQEDTAAGFCLSRLTK